MKYGWHLTVAFLHSYQASIRGSRIRLARCLMIRSQCLRVYPASPRITDAAFDGQPCRTVAAVCESTSAPESLSFGVLIDARAILCGWQTIQAVAGRISCIRVIVDLQRDAPLGWRVYLEGIPQDIDLFPVQPGQVLLACVAPATHPGAYGEQDSSEHTGTADSAQHGPTGEEGTGMPTTGPSDTAAAEGSLGDVPSTAQEGEPEHGSGRDIADAHVSCSFLILGQNYIAEHVEVRLPIGIDVTSAVARVAAARAPQDVTRLPLVQIVDPQPQSSHALCVAIPEWTTPGAIVAIDSRGINVRLFATELIGLVDRAGLLTVAQLEDRADVDIYIGNQPWPFVAGPSVRFANGDLILIVSTQARHHTVVSLQDMLASDHGWDADFDPATIINGGFNGFTWLLSDERSEVFVVRPERRRQIRQDLAAQLNASSRELVIQSARLASPDFAYKGIAVQTVLAALRHTNFLPSYSSRPVVCFVDARPVLLTVTWQVCPDGILNTNALAERFVPRCPPGYFVWLVNNDLTPITPGEAEPCQSTPALRAALAFLRYAAPRLGQGWRYQPPPDASFVVSDSEDEPSAANSDAEPVITHFAILTPGFTPERIRFLLDLPATLNEALRSIQALRSPDSVRRFSSLVPANPQPCPGSGVVLALPAWHTADNPSKVFLCLDTSRLDGRLFTRACPAYVSRRHLLHLASLPVAAAIQVHFGDDPTPLAQDAQYNVATGDTVVFVPEGEIVPTMHSLALDLFASHEWSRISTIPVVPDEGAYGLGA